MSAAPDELDWIAALRPLTRGAPAALGLLDDAAVLPARPGHDLVITEDAMVEGVHFLAGEAADVVARRLIRTNLSDLAAKAAEPFGYTLTAAWPAARGWDERLAFIAGLEADGRRFDLALLGGDTVATQGPLTVSATFFGWVEAGRAVLRSGAAPGDALVVCGTIGDAALGLKAARGEIADPGGYLQSRLRLPEPLLALREALRRHGRAAADVSDGLLVDALHVAEASGCAVALDLGLMPRSASAETWLDAEPDRASALAGLASFGDDYALVCASREPEALVAAAGAAGVPAAVVGRFESGAGLSVRVDGAPIAPPARLGWRHA